MGLFKRIAVWRDRRHELIQLRHEVTRINDLFRGHVKQHGFKERTDNWERAYSEFRNEYEFLDAEIDIIETKTALERANRWGAPIPRQPLEEDENDEYWIWNRIHAQYFLSSHGLREIRHSVSMEMDIFFRPWFSWGAIGISFLALVVSIFKP